MNLSTVTPSGFSLLQIEGPDAIKFLQGQVTCDLNTQSPSRLQHGAHCTAKGRMIANFDAIKLNEQTLWLRLPSDNLAHLQASLAKYIVFSKAKLTDFSQTHQSLALVGHEAKTWLLNAGFDFDEQQVANLGDHLAIKIDEQRYEVWSNSDASELAGLEALPRADDNSCWPLGDIESGKGWITSATSDAFLPQDLNLQTDAINGINFKKGCYTGQEIVARMHYKGKLKRHLYRFSTSSTQDIAAGAELVIGDSDKSVGTVINVTTSNEGSELLAVTTEATAEKEELRITGATTDKLALVALPYAITNESPA
ncbi:MAG: YgfZ/GcvT domain-containing protein [Cellvibrionaceae bacterium]